MMNRLLLALNALLLAAVVFLFFRVWKLESPEAENEKETVETLASAPKPARAEEPERAPTGKIAFVNIDRLNEESLELINLVDETKRKKTSIENSVQKLSEEYQKKVEAFEMTRKAGIAPESDLQRRVKEIQDLEQKAQEKQMLMDKLSMDISEQNEKFQSDVRDYLVRWNAGRYDYVLSFSEAIPSLLIGNPALEVTDEVIQGLNDEYRNRKKESKASKK